MRTKRVNLYSAAVAIAAVFFCAHPGYPQQVLPAQANPVINPVVVQDIPNSGSQEKNSLDGKFSSLSGDVKVRKCKSIVWQNARIDEEISIGDQIKTGPDGMARVEFDNGNVLYLKPRSILSVEELSVNPSTGKYDAVFKTKKGKIKAEVNDKEHLNKFEIRTPVAVAGVRGTILYMNVTPVFAQIFVEEGRAFVENTVSGKTQDVSQGFSSVADKSGAISEPVAPEPGQRQEMQGKWEPPPPPPGSVDRKMGMNEAKDQKQQQMKFQNNAMQDRKLSQESAKTDYVSNPPAPVIPLDTDGDYLSDADEVNLYHTDKLNRDTDNDNLSDWEEVKIQGSNPLLANSDGDVLSDQDDVFPNDASEHVETMTATRNKRYDAMKAKFVNSGLRAEIYSLLSDATERQKDYLADRVADAQMHKVMKNRYGTWVRLEEYILRPTPNQISMLALTRSSSAQVSTLSWDFTFASSLDGMTSQQIKNLPWEKYFMENPNYGALAPANYPVSQSVKLEGSSGGSIEETRNFASPALLTGNYVQSLSGSPMISLGGAPGVALGSISVVESNSNPAKFDYIWDSSGTQIVNFQIFVIDENGVSVGTHSFSSLGSVMAANLAGFDSVGNNYIEIFASKSGGIPMSSIDLIYKPFKGLTWRGSSDWTKDLTWQ